MRRRPYISTRLVVLLAGFCLVVAIFGARIYKLTILDGPKYRYKSENNYLREEPLIAPRGRILDSKGRPLAINQPLFDVEMSRFGLSLEEITATVNRVAILLNRPQIRTKAKAIAKLYPKWDSISLLDNRPLTLNEILPIREQAFSLPGVIITMQYQRTYPEGNIAGLVTGHVTKISKKKMDHFLEQGYMRTEKIGSLGAELTFESLLHGKHGSELVERDFQGRPRAQPYPSQPAQPGNTLTLTLDLELQRRADALLEGWNGAIVAMDPRDGAVLAMAARPHYDPNDPSGHRAAPGASSSFNKITRSKFAPGSTFKVVTAMAGLLAGYQPTDTADCNGGYTPPGVGVSFPCNLKSGHGSQNMYEALQHSCNVYFYRWAGKVGTERMLDAATSFGFGERTDFELVTPDEESPGKVAQIGDKIYKGSVIQMGIGQGALIDVTPIQMARAYAALVNGGTLFRPHILKEVRSAEGNPINQVVEYNGKTVEVGKPEPQGTLPLSEPQRKEILEGLWRVVNEKGGTGSHSGIKAEWHAAGKSGTAQTGRPGPPNAWFVCYAPAEAPEILLVILVEASGHGGEVAAPLARQLLAYHFGQPEPEIVPPPKNKPIQAGD